MSIKSIVINQCTCKLNLKSCMSLSDISDKSINMIITSPPYADLREIGVSPNNYVEWVLPLMQEISRVLVTNGNFILNINDVIRNGIVHPYIDDLKLALRHIGLNQVSKPYIWFKTTAIPNKCSHRAIDRYEYCFWFSNGKGTFYRDHVRMPYADITIKRVQNSDVISLNTRGQKGHKVFKKSKINIQGALPHNVLEISPECNPGIKHSAPFPIKLPEWFIKAGSKEGDVILDPFMGSGTTAIASLKNKRNVIGYEIDKKIYDYSVGRIENYFTSELLF